MYQQQRVVKAMADLGLPLRPEWLTKCMSGHQQLDEEGLWKLWLESDMKESSSGILPVGIGDEEGETKILPGRFMLQVESWKNVGEPLEHRSKDSGRRLLCFKVTDGMTSVRAIEYHHIDGFELKRLNIGLKIAVNSPENTEVIGGCLPRCCAPETDVVDLTLSVDAKQSHQQPLLPPNSSLASHPPPICDLSTITSYCGCGDGKYNPQECFKDSNVPERPIPVQGERVPIVLCSSERDKRSNNGLPEPLQIVSEAPKTTATQQHVFTAANSLELPLYQTPFQKETTNVVALNDLQKWHGSSVIVRANVTAIHDRLRLKKLMYAPLPVLIEDKTASAKARINSDTCMDLLGGMHATEFKALGKKDITAVSKIAETMGCSLLNHEWEITLTIPDATEDADSLPVITQMKSM